VVLLAAALWCSTATARPVLVAADIERVELPIALSAQPNLTVITARVAERVRGCIAASAQPWIARSACPTTSRSPRRGPRGDARPSKATNVSHA
jgi:hypothetical protein